MSHTRQPELLELPNEILQQIFYHVPMIGLFKNRKTCRAFQQNADGFLSHGYIKPLELVEFISNLNSFSAFEKFMEKFRRTLAYRNLMKMNFDDMSDEEKICFALIRDSKDLPKLDRRKLENALNTLQNILPRNIVESIQVTILAMKFSEAINLNIKENIQDEISNILINRHSPHATINLSGLKLSNINLNRRTVNGQFLKLSLNMVNMNDAELDNGSLSSCDLGGLSIVGATVENLSLSDILVGQKIIAQSNEKELVYLFNYNMLVNVKIFNKALNKIWSSFEKGFRSQNILSHYLYSNITYMILNQIRYTDLACKNKIDLIDAVIKHPMFNISHSIEFIKTGINYAASLWQPSQYNTSDKKYFKIYIDFKNYTNKFHELKNELIEQLRLETEEETYVQSLHCLSL